MAGTLALTRVEFKRLVRNKRYLIFTVAFPVVLYLLIGNQVKTTAYGVSFAAYYMLSMAMFGAFSGALTGNAQRISQEKKDGWVRQLRLTSLPANAYVVTKILVSLATTVPAIVIVLLLGLPGLVNLEVRSDVVQIQSGDSDATLYAILDAGYRPREIEVSSLGLEQAFIAITAEDDRANGNYNGETN